MNLDVKTLFLVSLHVEAILGFLLLFAWMQNPGIRGVAWWGGAHLLRAGSMILVGVYGTIPNATMIDLADALLLLTYAMLWTGARLFAGRRPMPTGLVAGSVLWLMLCQLAFPQGAAEWRAMAASGIVALYIWLAMYELWRGRREPLVSRWPAIFMLLGYGTLFTLQRPLAHFLSQPGADHGGAGIWLTALSFESLLFTIAIAFVLLAMAKERTEHRHRTAAMIDPLTGIANRRAFLHDAAALAKRHGAGTCPTAVLAIDLDHFKSINDRFGHAVGDRVLEIFAEVATGTMRASDIVGRLGGEEFAAVLYNANREKALAVADQIRLGFAQAAAEVAGHRVEGTLSIGMMLNEDAAFDIAESLAQADQALYRAKARGRNRVEVGTFDIIRGCKDRPRIAISRRSAA